MNYYLKLVDIAIAEVEVWFRFTLPVENTLRSFREKAKTQAYLTAVPQMHPTNGHFTAQGLHVV